MKMGNILNNFRCQAIYIVEFCTFPTAKLN